MNKSLTICLIILVGMFGCETEQKLEKSVFISDSMNPELPVYSEFGYNTFGAYFDRAPFVSEEFETPGKIVVAEGDTQFILKGLRKSQYANEPMQLKFTISDLNPVDLTGLATLHQRSIDLVSEQVGVTVTLGTGSPELPVEVIEGTLTFIRYQNVFVDLLPQQVILSGEFALQFTLEGQPVAIKSGRFDLGISPGNFFRI